MPFPRGADPEKAIYGYMQALQGFPVEAIATGVRKFLRGECEGVNPKFCPHPPELAAIVRGTLPTRSSSGPPGRLYGYHAPRTEIIESRCTKEWARKQIDAGIHPRGSIWCPGPLPSGGDEKARPDIGDLYAPDPTWRQPFQINEQAV